MSEMHHGGILRTTGISRRRLKICVLVSVLIHLLVLEPSVRRAIPKLISVPVALVEIRSDNPIFIDTFRFSDRPEEEPVADTPFVSQKSFRASDRMEGPEDGETPVRQEAPHDISVLAGRQNTKSDESNPSPEAAAQTETSAGGMSLRIPDQISVPPAENPSGVAQEGDFMYNVKKDEYADYYKHIRDKVILSWEARYSHDLRSIFVRNGRASILFQIMKDGRIASVAPAPGQNAALDLLAALTEVVKGANPLDKFPDKITEDHLNIRFDFYFY